MAAAVAWMHGIPIETQFPAKISPNDSPAMARIPNRRSPCGACSREEPQPKNAIYQQHGAT
ncbi:MAG TPA: hypothetical protein VGH36_09345 [Acetobacteraceae bacterium]|jgi:hypothetical protein